MAMKIVGYIRYEDAHIFYEVLRIKRVIDRSDKESDDELFKSLRRLQQMRMSMEILKETKIGNSVNNLRKHESRELRNLARTLIRDWKLIANSWFDATTAIEGSGKSITGGAKPVARPVIVALGAEQSSVIQKKPVLQRKKLDGCDNEASTAAKLEASKRKLHERYQEAQNAKKQRTTKMVELHDLPKQSLAQMNQWAQRRRS